MEQLPHILSASSFDREFVDSVISDTRWIKSQFDGNHWKGDVSGPSSLPHLLEGKTMMLLFDQPSKRTYTLFATAMYALGGNREGWQNASRDTSIAKGESLEETVRGISRSPTVSVLVIRHPGSYSVERASRQSAVPVINAGDGLEHPTQALKDLFTIDEELGQIDGLHVAITGDLRGRTVRSFLYALSLYKNILVSLVSPPQLRLPDDVKHVLRARAVPFVEVEKESTLAEVVATVDVVYVMRPQVENWSPLTDRLLQDYYTRCTVNQDVISNLPTHARVLHPLPHTKELAADLNPDIDQRLAYFRQEDNGGPLGIALLARLHLGPSWLMGMKKLS